MLWKRQIPILIVAVIGTLTLFGWFVNEPHIKSFVDDDATQWFDILASFAIFLGGFNLLVIRGEFKLMEHAPDKKAPAAARVRTQKHFLNT